MRVFCSALFGAGVVAGALATAGSAAGLRGATSATQDVSHAADQQPADDPAIRAAVERFYATQEAEDIDGYLALWSKHAQRPTPEQLKFVFDSGDDKFTNIALLRVLRTGNRVRVRASVARERTIPGHAPGPGAGASRIAAMTVGLTFEHEDGEWKLVREGTPADDLAGALIDAASPAERTQLLVSEPDLVGPALLRALAQRATDAAQRRAYGQAEKLFKLVIEVAQNSGDRAAEGEALQNLANTLYFSGRNAEALAAYEQRLSLERERNDEAAIASAVLGIATVRYAYAEYGPALTAYREALAIQERLADEAAIATTLISTGNVLYLQGDYDAAIADYRRSLTLSRKTPNRDAEMRALEGLGRVFTAQGDFGAALAAFSAVLAEAKARNDRGRQGTALQHIGEIQFKLGNLDEARTSFDTSRRHHDAGGDLPNVGRLWQAIALTDLVAGRYELAEKEYTTSIGICGGAGDGECVARATVGLGFAQATLEKYTESIAAYGKAIDAFTALGRREDAARAQVGRSQAFAGKGDLEAALTTAVGARHAAVGLGAEDVVWRALLAEARVLRRKGDTPAALGAARAAVAAVERLQQVATEQPGILAPADGDAAFATLAVLEADSGEAGSAFRTAEQMRLYRLRVTLAPNERDIARGMTAAEREEERAAAAQVISLGAQVAREKSLPKPDRTRLERLEKAQSEALARRAAHQRRLFERLPDLRSWRGLGRPAQPDDVECVLTDTGSVLLAFIVDEDDLLTLVAVRGDSGVTLNAYLTRITKRVLAERVNALLQPDSLRSVGAWRRLAGELASLLPPEAISKVSDASRALVIPDAALWRLPFEALPLADGYLADRAPIAYASSVTAALQVVTAGNRAPRRRMVAVAAPEVPPGVAERVLSTAPGWIVRRPERGRTEVAALAAVDAESEPPAGERALVLSGAEATEARVRERAPGARVLHFASPFRVNAASPLFSPLLLGGDTLDAASDGALEAREIMNLDWTAEVAVLSDGSALAMRDAARALDAIEWAWRAAGVSSLVIPRWGGESAASDRLLAEFHRRLAAGSGVDDALPAARANVRAAAATAAPFYWAGWMLIAQQPVRVAPAPR